MRVPKNNKILSIITCLSGVFIICFFLFACQPWPDASDQPAWVSEFYCEPELVAPTAGCVVDVRYNVANADSEDEIFLALSEFPVLADDSNPRILSDSAAFSEALSPSGSVISRAGLHYFHLSLNGNIMTKTVIVLPENGGSVPSRIKPSYTQTNKLESKIYMVSRLPATGGKNSTYLSLCVKYMKLAKIKFIGRGHREPLADSKLHFSVHNSYGGYIDGKALDEGQLWELDNPIILRDNMFINLWETRDPTREVAYSDIEDYSWNLVLYFEKID